MLLPFEPAKIKQEQCGNVQVRVGTLNVDIIASASAISGTVSGHKSNVSNSTKGVHDTQ